MRPIENVEQVPQNANSDAAAIRRLQLIKNALKRFVCAVGLGAGTGGWDWGRDSMGVMLH